MVVSVLSPGFEVGLRARRGGRVERHQSLAAVGTAGE